MADKARGLSRVPYALISIPMLVLVYMPVGTSGVRLLNLLGFSLATFALPMIALQVASSLLIVPLIMVTIGRLRHAGLAWWLASPLMVTLITRLYMSSLAMKWFDGKDVTGLPVPVIWLGLAAYLVSLVVVVGLVFVPGRRVVAKPVVAF